MNSVQATNTFQLDDHGKQYDNDAMGNNKTEQWKLDDSISQNGYGNAIIGRYGGCFEEDIRWLMHERAYHIMGFGCTSQVCTNSQGEQGQCTISKKVESAYNPWTQH